MKDINQHPVSEDISLISEAVSQEIEPIQKNSKLFKFILYTTKVEIKFNSLIRLVFNTSVFELALWILGFLLFIASPKDMFLIWLLIGHLIKAAIGIVLLDKMPKTYEILENVAKDPNFDESKIIELLENEIKLSFMNKWANNKSKFFAYLICTIICLGIDFIIFIVQICAFGKEDWFLMQTCMLFTILVFIVTDVIYFLWFFTLKFTFPKEIIDPIKKAIFGSVNDLKAFIKSKLNFQGRSQQQAPAGNNNV